MMKAAPPLPDWLLMRMMGSYSRPTSAGSMGRYGISQYGDFDSRMYSWPLLIAS